MLALILLLFFQLPVGGPTQVNNPDYPLQVQVVQRNQTRQGRVIKAFGRANLFGQAGTPEQGFDYEADCDVILMVSHGPERYSARWKKPGLQLEILYSKIGTGKSNKCTVKTDPKQFIYAVDERNHIIVTRPLPPTPQP
jgi:hypothetical protein